LKGPFFLTQKLLPLIADGGSIVNVSTGLARYVYPGFSAYAAVKGALEVLTRALAVELGPRRIRVNAVAPGGIVTDFGGGALRDAGLQQAVAAETPLGRIGQPEDVAGVIAALLGPGMRWVNGQRVEVTGGYRL
jgi:NAD(P)-dependent dehydrogenase (short-subunit alcohol dehydrogenase family)